MARTAHRRRAPVAVLTAAACLLIAVAQAAAAPADEFPVGGSAMNDAWSTASEFWSGAPCGGTVTLKWATLDDSVNAQSAWAATDQSRPATYTDCSIVFNQARSYDYPMLCTIMTHEMGHLLGQPHSADTPDDVMSPSYLQPIGPCDTGTETFEAPAPQSTTVARAASIKKAKARRAKARKAKAKARRAKRSAQRRHRAA